MSGAILGIGAKVALGASGFGDFIKKNPWVGYIIAGLIALGIVGFMHHRAVVKHDQALVLKEDGKRDAMWQARFDQMTAKAKKIAADATALSAKITAKNKEIYNAQISSNAALAAAVLRNGPGKAAAIGCRPIPYAPIPVTAGPAGNAPGSNASSAQVLAGNRVSSVPDPSQRVLRDSSLALVPWGWLTQMAQEHDDLLARDAAYSNGWDQQAAAYEALRQKLLQATGDKPH